MRKRVYRRRAAPKKKSTQLVTKSQLYKAISKNIETKQVTLEFPYTSFNSGISSNAEMYSLLPACSQGTGSNQKIGDQIRPKRLEIRGYVNYRSNENYFAQSIISNLFLFQPKDIKHVGLNSNVTTDILTNGSSPSAFTGGLIDIVRPFNKEKLLYINAKKWYSVNLTVIQMWQMEHLHQL